VLGRGKSLSPKARRKASTTGLGELDERGMGGEGGLRTVLRRELLAFLAQAHADFCHGCAVWGAGSAAMEDEGALM
jgi:hypothetical protein